MTEPRPRALTELDTLDVGPAPVGAILATAHASRHRRRTALAGAAAVAALLAGGGFITTQVLADDTDTSLVAGRDTTGSPRPAEQVPLEVVVESFTPASSLSGVWTGLARWDDDRQVLDYLTTGGYSSSCPPVGTANVTGDGPNLVLSATGTPEGQICTADDRLMLVTITGLDEAPPELTVTEDGQTRTIAVLDGAVPPNSAQRLSCPAAESNVWTTDQSQPPAGIGPDEALDRFRQQNPGYAEAAITERSEEAVIATVTNDDGAIVALLSITPWPNGSYAVEGGAYCDGLGFARSS